MVLRYISNSFKKNYKDWFIVGEFTFMDKELKMKNVVLAAS